MHSDFKTKPIYIQSKSLYTLVEKTVSSKTPYYLKDQIMRATLSIILNFSEGYGQLAPKR